VSIINKVSNKTLMPGITPIADVPDAPTIGTATNVGTSRAYNNGSATVTYTAAATGGAVTTFTATSTPGSFTATGASPLTVTGLQSATSYTFAVSAANSSGTLISASSSSITATTVPATPSAPTATDAGSGRAYNSGSASVAFTAPATGGSAITAYTVTSSPGSLTGTGSSSPITVTGQSSATAYTYTLTATNANGTSSASSASASVTATTVPQAPTIGTASVTNSTTVSIPFTAGATGGSAITSYTATSSPSIALSVSGTSTPLTVTGTFSANQAYTFTIAAVNANGTSTSSSSSNSITPLNNVILIGGSDVMYRGTTIGTYTSVSYPGTSANSRGRLIYHASAGLFMLCSTGSTYYTSPDGITWTTRTLPNDLYSGYVGWIYDGTRVLGRWNSGSGSGFYIYYTTDGINWTGYATNNNSTGGAFGYANGYYFLGNPSTAFYYYGTLGGALTTSTSVGSGYNVKDVVGDGSGTYAAVTFSDDASDGRLYKGSGPAFSSWTVTGSSVLNNAARIDRVGSNFVGTGDGGSNPLVYSSNANSWTQRNPSTNPYGVYSSAAYINGTYLLLSKNGGTTYMISTTDFNTFNSTTIAANLGCMAVK